MEDFGLPAPVVVLKSNSSSLDNRHACFAPFPDTISGEDDSQRTYSYRLRKIEKIQVWQEGFTNHRIRDVEDYIRHCEYIRMNPVRARLVQDGAQYGFSSAGFAFQWDEAPPGLKPRFPRSA